MPSNAMPTSLSEHNQAPLGQRLRDRRNVLGMTLKEVADKAGLSVGFISQLERDLTAPSLSSLASIAKILGLPVTDFLSQPSGVSPISRSTERSLYGVNSDAKHYERISASFKDSVLNSVIIHEPPGYRSEPIRHEGEELFYILSGSITVEVENEANVLSAGDSFHFRSSREHSCWNHTTSPATILHVCTMDVFGDNSDETRAPGNRAGHDDPIEAPKPSTFRPIGDHK